ncbi:MAG: YjiK family protein [Cytophagales bacterium]|nr:YjiK family protein [Cytophagales bacterium]
MKNTGILLCFVLLSLTYSCESGVFGQREDSWQLQTESVRFWYDVKSPIEKYFLPYVLEEVSGLSYKSPSSILAVDDEKGKIFEYDLAQRDIINTIKFYHSADFEGVEFVGKRIFALRSDGDIFEINYSEMDSAEPEKYENALSIANDTEGLGYDPKSNRLLIACKEKGEIGKKEVKGKAIYGFDLNSKKLDKKPILTISEKQLKRFWKENGADTDKNHFNFKPSAIAFHPIQEVYYILSSSGKLLIVVDRDEQILATYPLSSKVLYQPEGLCFSPKGDMYISSEGDGGRGYILKYEMIKK